jgi:hypothetical protein
VTVYRWVDEQGKVHYADRVPERYRSTAQPVQAPADAPTAEPPREARERARREASAAAAPPGSADGARTAAAPAPAASQPPAKRPAQLPDDRTDCETWQRLYRESVDCFGPYRTVGGGIKPQAFEVCNVVPAPTDRCRLRIP